MGTEIVKGEEAAVAPVRESNLLQAVLTDPAKLKEVPIDAIERMFALDEKLRAEAAEREFNEAFNRVQRKLQENPVTRHGRNPHTKSRYARADELFKVLDPIILDEGFSRSLSMKPSDKEDTAVFVMTLRHVGGHKEVHQMEAALDYLGPRGQPVKSKLHGMASSGTYCERQLALKVFAVQTTDDDDGNAGAGIGESNEPLTKKQLAALEKMLSERVANLKIFLDYFGADSIENISTQRFNEAVEMLMTKPLKAAAPAKKEPAQQALDDERF